MLSIVFIIVKIVFVNYKNVVVICFIPKEIMYNIGFWIIYLNGIMDLNII